MEYLSFEFADKAKVPCYLGLDVQAEVMEHILELQPDKVLLVCDKVAHAHHASYFEALSSPPPSAAPGESRPVPAVETHIVPGGDECKSWEQLSGLVRWAFDKDATKKSLIVAFGGGALMNLSGLFASILFRGTKLVYVPTTFLAMHDVTTSLKTSICYDGRKNNIGSFYAPVKILIDVAFCRTLPRKELFSGVGELAKNAALFGGKHAEGFRDALSKEHVDAEHGGSGEELMMNDQTMLLLVRLGIEAKMTILLNDAYEKTSGMIFEYGHTVSHALEKAYGDGVIPHGLGVTYGMLSSSFAAERLGIMTAEDRREHDALCWLLLKRWPLPDPKPTIEHVMGLAMRDSKRGLCSEAEDEISDVLLYKMGHIVPTKTNMLSKFPANLLFKWLYTMGFPAEGAVAPEPAKQGLVSAVEWKAEGRALLERVRQSSDEQLLGEGFEALTVGFVNHVWATQWCYQPLVVKRYTDVVFLRLEAEAVGVVDGLAGRERIGPEVLHSSPQGLVMRRLEGQTLCEADVHAEDLPLLGAIAKQLARLHSLEVPKECEGSPMLWRTIDRMLEAAARRPELLPEGVPSIDVIRSSVADARQALEQHRPKVTLSHGDFKPSNVIRKGDAVWIIDHELGGPNYRAYDLMKLFRTKGDFSQASMTHFLHRYLEFTMHEQPSEADVAAVLAETRIFEPLTWLEASIFFLTMPHFKPSDTPQWNERAVGMWKKFEETRSMLG